MSETDARISEELPPSQSLPRDNSGSFTDLSYLTYLVPSETDIDLDEAFKGLEQGKSILESIPQRETLFFDETVQVLLILKTPWVEEKELQSSLQRLMISLAAHVVNSPTAANRDAPAPAASESIYVGAVGDISDPFVVVDEEASSDSDSSSTTQYLYAVWKLAVPLSRPRMRLHRPSVVFSASAGVKPEQSAAADQDSGRTAGYLQSGVPSGLNLLESFAGDPALHGVRPRLSALRVSRVAPVTRQQDLLTRLRTLPQLQLPIAALVHARIRFARPSAAPPTSTVVALLEFDFTPDLDCEALVDRVALTTSAGTVTSLTDHDGDDVAALRLPISCVSHDHVTLVYEIRPHRLDINAKDASNTLHIVVSASIQVAPGVCTPRIDMAWTASLDFATPLNPSFGPVTETTGIQRAHRPAQLSIASSNNSASSPSSGAGAVMPLKSPSVTRPDSLPMLEASAVVAQTAASVPNLGITMSFNAPAGVVRPGDVFSWTVYVLNRTSEASTPPPPPSTAAQPAKSPRKLALVAIPRRRRPETARSSSVRPPSTASRRHGEKEIASAVVDDNVLHALQKNAVLDGADLVCLSADTRVGPLGPGACHVVELQFLALRPGIAGIEAIRVVDLGSQEHVDIRDLPTTVIEPLGA
ncbi:hypothetical protein LMH87_004091 [Akanthomyces muscarius]|uniref:Trafficking protein particle complex II-specific subunit 65 IgD3 domain-containing protein n=1 Tax=Akanthomyces muscarius TaxID=2231603 RepID=A0A9W8Q2M8_AKAMU|nr:hypothetical protein LMH87_004091 [Akanthomyces muscarius]KAJ4145236.1 hypothetical protein LMH87_004091 [Akanthomyces muscarius]